MQKYLGRLPRVSPRAALGPDVALAGQMLAVCSGRLYALSVTGARQGVSMHT
jgi:3-oxoacyl-[acyl-carrier-protein] synthase III